MNTNTRIALTNLADELANFANALSSVAGTQASSELIKKCYDLVERLQKDETIP